MFLCAHKGQHVRVVMLLKPSNLTYTYDSGNDDGKVNCVADNKMPQQMVFHGAVCCLHKCQIVIC